MKSKEKNREQENSHDSIKIEKPKPKYDLETIVISDENVTDFLMWYGEQNNENKVLIEKSEKWEYNYSNGYPTVFYDVEIEKYNLLR